MGDEYKQILRRHETVIVEAYNIIAQASVESLEEIPDQALHFLGNVKYNALVEPLVLRDLRNGMRIMAIARRYVVDRQVVRTVKKKYSL